MPSFTTTIRPEYWAKEMRADVDPILGYEIVRPPMHIRWYRRDTEVEYYALEHRRGRADYIRFHRAVERGDLVWFTHLRERYEYTRGFGGDDHAYVQGWAAASRAYFLRNQHASKRVSK